MWRRRRDTGQVVGQGFMHPPNSRPNVIWISVIIFFDLGT